MTIEERLLLDSNLYRFLGNMCEIVVISSGHGLAIEGVRATGPFELVWQRFHVLLYETEETPTLISIHSIKMVKF